MLILNRMPNMSDKPRPAIRYSQVNPFHKPGRKSKAQRIKEADAIDRQLDRMTELNS